MSFQSQTNLILMIKQEISDQLLDEVGKAYVEAKESVSSARDGMFSAIDKSLYCASLVEKCKELRKHDLAGFLSPVMSGQEVKRLLSLHDASKKRSTIHDKRQLFLTGILEPSQVVELEKKTPIPHSVISTTRKYIGTFSKAIRRRPASEMENTEREQIKEILKPVIEFYESL